MPIPIIPENINKRKFLLISKFNLNIFDLIWILFVFIPFLVPTLMMYKENKIVFILLIIPTVISIFSNMVNKKYELKNYEIFFKLIQHKLISKKYIYNTKMDTRNLIPYKKITEEYIELENKTFVSFLKIRGNNFFDLDSSRQDYVLDQIWNTFKRFDLTGGSLIKIEEFKNNKENLLFLEEKQHFWESKNKDKKINDQQFFSREYILEEMKKNQLKNIESRETNNTENNIYIAIYAKTIAEIKYLENCIVDDFKNIHLRALKINVYDKINVINKLLEMEIEDVPEQAIDKYRNNLADFFAYEKLENKGSYLKIDNERSMFIEGVSKYPYEPSMCWLKSLFQLPHNVIVNFQKSIEGSYEQALSKAQRIAQADAEGTSKKYVLSKKKKEKEIEKLENFSDIIGYGGDTLYRFNAYILHKTYLNIKNARKISNNEIKETNKDLNEMRMKPHYFYYMQYEAFSGMLPKPYDPLILQHGHEIPIFTLAFGNPFIENNLNDPEGLFIGRSKLLNEDIVFNPHYKDNDRKNSNMFLLATSGAGKSTSSQKMLINEMVSGSKVYIIDPESEYKNIALFFGENYIDLSKDIYKINPLQITESILDLEEDIEEEKKEEFWLDLDDKVFLSNSKLDKNDRLILRKQTDLEILFKTFYNDITDDEIRFLKTEFFSFYKIWISTKINKKILEWKNNEFPILQDFYEYLIAQKRETRKPEYLEKWISILEDGFIENKETNHFGSYSIYYNGYTTLDFSDKFLNVFDVSGLFTQGNKQLRQMQMYLIMQYIQQKVKLTWKKEPDIKQRIIVDEAHLLIDRNRPLELDFLYQTVKMIRKRNGGITIITQNPEDFVETPELEKKTKAIINNSQYALIMNSTNDNVKKIELMFSDSDGFTENEKNGIVNASKGEGLLIVGKNNNRYQMKFDILPYDYEVIENRQNSLLDFTLKSLSLRIFNRLGQLKYVDISTNNIEQILYIKNSFDLDGLFKIKMNKNFTTSIIDTLNKNMEIEKIYLDNENWLNILFKNTHKKIVLFLYDKYRKKIENKIMQSLNNDENTNEDKENEKQ